MSDPLETRTPRADSIPATVVGSGPLREAQITTVPSGAPSPEPVAGGVLPVIPGYEILEVLGRGGMGIVYRARQLAVRRDVALKMIRSGSAADADDHARFRREAEAIGRLHHPHIVAIFDVGEAGGHPYFSMEYCPGGSLAGRLRATGLSCDEAARLLSQIASAVGALHGLGIVHRDLKPQNVLLTAEGEPKVSDFGLAKLTADLPEPPAPGSGAPAPAPQAATLTQTGAMLGTPAYMAPEQAFGESKRVGPAADVHALGAILYEALVGEPPFRADSLVQVLQRVLEDEPLPPRRLRPEIPRDLELICLKCLEKPAERRYPTARELADDLERYLRGEPVSVVRSGLLDRMAGAFERVRLQERFADYGTLLLSLAPIMVVSEFLVSCIVWNDWPNFWLPVTQVARIGCVLLVVAVCRGGSLRPDGLIERHLWTVWGGYLVTCAATGGATRAALGWFTTTYEAKLYVAWSMLTALAFFSIASWFWGRAIVVGLVFLTLPFLMAVDLDWAPLEFGTTWAAVLTVLGLRLRALSRTRR